MTFFHAFILGVVQGLTEFIPVSSTAHLVIVSKILGIPSDARAFAFSVIIQLGTIVSLLLFFGKDIWLIVRAFFAGIKSRKPFDDFHARLGWLVIVATLPALTAGFILKEIVHENFTDPFTQGGIRLLVTAGLLTAIEQFKQRGRGLDSANWLDALVVGFFQALAIFPGASRSGSTIAGGMIRGFNRPSAARFAFLMSAPILTAAGLYETLQVIAMPDTASLLPYLLVGFITAAVVGWAAIKWLMAYISKHSLYIFTAYCAVAGVVVLLIR